MNNRVCVCVWANESLLQPLHRCFVGHHHFIPPQADWAGRRAVKTGFSSAVCSHDFTGGGTPLSALNALTAGTDGRHAAWRVTVGAVVLHPKAHLTVEGENTGRIIRQGCSIYSLHTTYHSGFKQLHAYIHIHIRQLIIPRAKVPARSSDARLFSLSLSFQSDVDHFLVKHHTDIVNESSPSWGSTGILSCKAEQLPVPNTSGLSYLFFPSVPSFIVPSKVSLCMYFSHVQHSNYGLSRCCVVFSPAKVLSSVVWRSSSWFYRGSYCVSLPRWEEHYQNRPFKLFSFLSRHLKELSDI